ncbi:MAG: VWA domain-containing protein [Pseudomonadota bacterium]
MSALHWREPLWLLLALLPLLPFLWRRLRGGEYAAPHLLPWVALPPGRRPLWRNAAWLAGWGLLAMAAAGPRLPLDGGEAALSGGTVLALVDLSRSMAAADVLPDRRRRAALELHALLEQARGSRIGVIVYAGRPHLYVPPTADHQALRFYLESLDRLVLPTHGSRLAPALALARSTLAGEAGAVALFTDGTDDADAAAAVRALTETGATLHVLGLGTAEGEAIPLPGGGWLKDAEGRPLIARLDEPGLAALARLGGGSYRRIAPGPADWSALVAGLPAAAPGPEAAWRELYPRALLPAVLLLFLALMPYGFGRAALGLLLLPALLPPPTQAADTSEAYRAYQTGDYATAAVLYSDLPGASGRLGEGASHYQAGDYVAAAQAFTAAVLAARDDGARADALFNLGAALYRRGDYAGAAQVYGDVLRYRGDDAAAAHNRALSLALWQAVQSHLGTEAAARPGRGPRSGRAVPGMSLGEDVRLSLDDAAAAAPLPALPADAATLIEHGLEHAALAATGAGASGRAWQQDLAQARLRMLALEDDPALLWQRLFEAEEGFPAPLREPREMPGVAPW